MFLKITTFDVFYFWRVLLVITTPPPLYDYSTLFSHTHIHLSLHSFQENWHDQKKFWRFHQIHPPPTHTHTHIVQGGWCHEWLSPGTVALGKNSKRTNYVVCKKFFLKRILQVQVEKISPIWDIVVKTFYP